MAKQSTFNRTIREQTSHAKDKKATAKPSTSWWVGLKPDDFYAKVREEEARLAASSTQRKDRTI